MRDDGATGRASDVDDLLQLVQRERRACFAVWPPPIIGVDLDPIRTVSDLVAHDPREVRAVRLLPSPRKLDVAGVVRAVAAGGDDSAGDDDHARTGDDALCDGALEAHVGV